MRLAGISLGLALLSVSLAPHAAEPEVAKEPRATMHRIFDALAYLLPASLDEERFSSPAGLNTTLAKIDVLVDSADRLEHHARSRDPAFRFLARSLVADVAQIRRRYEHGRYRDARYFLGHLTETCVACHSRLPTARDFPLAQQLLDSVSVDSLSPTEMARLQVATRQFAAALDTYESLFADAAIQPARMDFDGYFINYLTLCIRVERDLKRPAAALRKVAARADTPLYLRRNLRSWMRALERLQAQGEPEPGLERARALVDDAQRESAMPSDQVGLVYYLSASSVLHRYVDAGRQSGPELAEAFYLLGVSDARARRSYWVSEAEFYFETAVRMAPESPVAQKAYALLEEYTVLGYSGSSGVHIPPDVQKTLDELRALMDAP